MGRTYVPHQAKQGLDLCNTLLVDGGPPRALWQIALRELACSAPSHVCTDISKPSRCVTAFAVRCIARGQS